MGTKRAKAQLRGHWGQAIGAEGSVIGGQWLLYLAEWGLLLWCGLPIDGTPAGSVEAGDYRGAAVRLTVAAGIVVLDWLLLSPLKFGRATLYFRILSAAPPSRPLSRFFRGGRYRRALGWRLHLWGRRLWWSLLFWSPAVALWSMGEHLRLQAAGQGGMSPLSPLFSMSGTLLYLVGWLLVEVMMLRYLPAACGMEQGMTVRAAFRHSRRVMKGHLDALLRFYGRNLWRLCSCVLVLPALYVMPLFRMERAYRLRLWAKMAAPIEKTTIIW